MDQLSLDIEFIDCDRFIQWRPFNNPYAKPRYLAVKVDAINHPFLRDPRLFGFYIKLLSRAMSETTSKEISLLWPSVFYRTKILNRSQIWSKSEVNFLKKLSKFGMLNFLRLDIEIEEEEEEGKRGPSSPASRFAGGGLGLVDDSQEDKI